MDKIKIKETKLYYQVIPGWKRLNSAVSDKKLYAKYTTLEQMYEAINFNEFDLILKFNTFKEQDMIANFNFIQHINQMPIHLDEKKIKQLNEEQKLYFQISPDVRVLLDLSSLNAIKQGFIINNNKTYLKDLFELEQLYNPELTGTIFHYQKSGYEIVKAHQLT